VPPATQALSVQQLWASQEYRDTTSHAGP